MNDYVITFQDFYGGKYKVPITSADLATATKIALVILKDRTPESKTEKNMFEFINAKKITQPTTFRVAPHAVSRYEIALNLISKSNQNKTPKV